jgi:endonuclease YncB( thermonuclease family)
MSRTNTIKKHGWRVLTAGVALSLSTLAPAAGVEFVPYVGKREATLVRVDAPDRIVVTFDSDMVGFVRTLAIKVPGIVVAQDTPRADECERAAAKRAMSFTEKFLADAKKIYVQDVRMTNAADDDGVSPILTDKGSLSAALIKEGIARPDTVDPDTPWCK